MPDNWWGQFGGDYNTVNKNLGGLPDVVRKVAAAPAPDQGYSLRKAAISSAPGIAKMLGTSDQEVQQAQEWRKGFDASNLAQNQELLSKNKTYGNIVPTFVERGSFDQTLPQDVLMSISRISRCPEWFSF